MTASSSQMPGVAVEVAGHRLGVAGEERVDVAGVRVGLGAEVGAGGLDHLVGVGNPGGALRPHVGDDLLGAERSSPSQG